MRSANHIQEYRVNKNHRMLVAVALLAVLLSATFGNSQTVESKDSRYYESLARKAYQEKNYAGFLENLKLASDLRPQSPRLLYNLAIAYALNNKNSDAVSVLRRLADMGVVYPADSNQAFNSLKPSPEFTAIVQQFERNKRPIINSSTAFTAHEKGLVPESVAYDPVTGTFYLSSVYRRKIVTVDAGGAVHDFASASDGLWSVMGMRVDSQRRLLWACTAAHRQMANYVAAEDGSSAILKFDLKTRKLLRRYDLQNTPEHHWLGDLVIKSNGDVYASDSVSPAIYLISRQTDKLELFLKSDSFVNPQGLAFTGDEKKLFMADYLNGIFLIDMESKSVSPISVPPNITLFGIDGLYRYKDTLIGVQNGVGPNRIVQLMLDQDLKHVANFKIIEVNNTIFDEPTLGVLAGDEFYFIANSQWGMISEKGQLADESKLTEPVVLKIKLKG